MSTLLEVRTRVRQRSGHEHSQEFVTDAELNQLINLKYKELYGLLSRLGLARNETAFAIAANGSETYALPDDFWALLAVFRDDGLGARTYLTRHDHRYRSSTENSGPASTYRVRGYTIEFNTRPSDGDYTLVYIPVPATLAADTDELDDVLGWDEYIVVAVSLAVAIKDKVDTTDLRVDLAELKERIIDEAKAVELSENPTVQDVRRGPMCLPGGDRGVSGVWGNPFGLFRRWF